MLIVGNQRTSRDTIFREVQLKSGQPLSQQQEDETRTRITSLGLFRRVDISYLQLPGEQNRRDVVITVEEAPVTTISYGGGLEGGRRLVRTVGEPATRVEEFQVAPRGFFQVEPPQPVRQGPVAQLVHPRQLPAERGQRNAQCESHCRRPTTADTASTNISRVLTYGERRILGTDADVTISGGVEQAVRSSFDFNRRGASATLTRRLSRTLAVSGRYGIDHTRLLNMQVELCGPARDRSAVSTGAPVERGVVHDSRHTQRFDRAD